MSLTEAPPKTTSSGSPRCSRSVEKRACAAPLNPLGAAGGGARAVGVAETRALELPRSAGLGAVGRRGGSPFKRHGGRLQAAAESAALRK
eukprot:6214509-Pleurochrysis_carterae.AAC.2